MDPVARILDANANRASEALRTLEDIARFALNDGKRSGDLKELRHGLAAALARLPEGWLAANRDSAGDVGTRNATPQEYRRAGLPAVALAAGKRLAEALRVLEEVAKTLDPTAGRELAEAFEATRYRSYHLAREIARRLPGRRREQWRVCVLLTESLCRRPWLDVARAAIDGGAECLQLREKSLDDTELLRRLDALVEIARPRSVRVIVNDRPDLALLASADGVHLGQRDLPALRVRQWVGDRFLIGTSTHTIEEAASVDQGFIDYCGVGAMFPGGGKPDAPRSGIAYLKAFLARYPEVPHLAIGGITPDNLPSLIEAGCEGVAVSSVVCGAEHPESIVESLRRTFDRSLKGASSA